MTELSRRTVAAALAALFGAFGMLALGTRVVLRATSADRDPPWCRRSFWLANAGLAVMVLASPLPVGFLQLDAVYTQGYAAADAGVHRDGAQGDRDDGRGDEVARDESGVPRVVDGASQALDEGAREADVVCEEVGRPAGQVAEDGEEDERGRDADRTPADEQDEKRVPDAGAQDGEPEDVREEPCALAGGERVAASALAERAEIPRAERARAAPAASTRSDGGAFTVTP
ncbi:hypothetical protein [Halocalculus aciditolerans]|uniref:Uncharacterized protein n=1 Tax=Halocalculus aciditolerans TaxID=1383812 RepID=A0A830F3V2_9EURY|nr:hypothetical protein [Halocalculus aciditolerans]GGL60676.1 hypothetical protein GCM10009039_18680 [Halocalculus aciditolerans]